MGTVSAVDVDGITATVFKQPRLLRNGCQIKAVKRKAMVPRLRNDDEFLFRMKENSEENSDDSGLVLDLGFYGHYNEPRLPIRLNECLDGLAMEIVTKEWTVQRIDFEPLPVFKDTYCFTVKEKKEKVKKDTEEEKKIWKPEFEPETVEDTLK